MRRQIDEGCQQETQAIVRAFNTVATAVVEAEANILPARERFARRATKLYVLYRSVTLFERLGSKCLKYLYHHYILGP
jgi:hypothetical protein